MNGIANDLDLKTLELLKVSIKAYPPSILVYRSRSPKDMANIDADLQNEQTMTTKTSGYEYL